MINYILEFLHSCHA